ncbi:MAG: HlyD family efflux transporter periplasmic adaptor subunit [Rhodomicrobium sp.]
MRHPPKSRLLASAAVIMAVAIALAAHGFYRSNADPAANHADGMTVTVAEATRRCFADLLTFSGFLVPSNEVLVKPDREGLRIAEIMVESGQHVERGQVLARLTPVTGVSPAIEAAAPASGTLLFGSARLGALATAMGEPLFRIVAGGELDAEAEVPVMPLQKIFPGQEARIALPGGPETEGRVKAKSFWVDPSTQLGRIRVSLSSGGKMQAGSFVKINVVGGESCGMTVPLSAILYGPGGAFVQVVKDRKVETRRVRVGFLSGNAAEIREGVNENDMVVAKAGAFLREGDIVRSVLAGARISGDGWADESPE